MGPRLVLLPVPSAWHGFPPFILSRHAAVGSLVHAAGARAKLPVFHSGEQLASRGVVSTIELVMSRFLSPLLTLTPGACD